LPNSSTAILGTDTENLVLGESNTRSMRRQKKVYHTTKPSEDASEELRILKDAMATGVGIFRLRTK
jgi:hypothetical protein